MFLLYFTLSIILIFYSSFYLDRGSQPNTHFRIASPEDVAEVMTDESQGSQSSQDEYEPAAQASRSVDDTIHLSLPRKSLFSEAADVSARIGISNRQQVALTAKIIKMGGGNLEDVTLSVSSAWRQRTKAIKKREGEIMADFKEHMPSHIVIHWDGKVIQYDKGDSDDRLCVKVCVWLYV